MHIVRRIEVNSTVLRVKKIEQKAFRKKLDEKLKREGINADITEGSEGDCLSFSEDPTVEFKPSSVPRRVDVGERSAIDTPQNVVFGSNVMVGPNVFVGAKKASLLPSDEVSNRVIALIIETAKELWPREA